MHTFLIITLFLPLQLIVIINSKSLNNQINKVDNPFSGNNKNSEISHNNTSTGSADINNKSDNLLMLKQFKFINKKNIGFNTNRNDSKNNARIRNVTETTNERLLNFNEGRGKTKKLKKHFGMLIPVALIALAAKSVFLPFLLKGLTILSASSFVLSKISLVLSVLILLRLLYVPSNDSKVEIHSAPLKYNRPGWGDRQANNGYGDDINIWDDPSYSNANYSAAFPYNHFQI